MPENRFAFFGDAIVPIEEAKVSIMTSAFNYGTGVFEGIRAYWNEEEDQLFVFRLLDHFKRFRNSCKILMIELPYSPEQLAKITLDLLAREGYRQDVYIRPLAYKASPKIGVRLHDLEDACAIFAVPFGKYIESPQGIRAMVSSWRRNADNAIPARGKITGAYANSALAKSQAALEGFDEAIVLDQEGHVSEGSAENIFIIRGRTLITPPPTADILEGITRETIKQLAQEALGVSTVERIIDRTELYVADEAFFCGTGVELMPIIEIDRRPVGDGAIGPITQELADLYFKILRGREPRYRDWCTPVYTKSKALAR